jgi:LPS-assembly lipoprotein
MSSSRRRFLLGLSLSLAGCGYHPLYGERGGTTNAPVTAELAAIQIEAIPDRIGQQMYTMLRERLNPYGKPDEPRYVLSIKLTEKRTNFFFEKDETATRANLMLKADYVLKRAGSNEIVTKGLSRSVSSYDILASQFASVVSEEDARVRSAQAISDDIRTRLALALGKDGSGS